MWDNFKHMFCYFEYVLDFLENMMLNISLWTSVNIFCLDFSECILLDFCEYIMLDYFDIVYIARW